MKHKLLLTLLLGTILCTCTSETHFNNSNFNTTLSVQNSWVINEVSTSSDVITKDGITNWTNAKDTIRTFFYAEKDVNVPFGIVAKTASGTSTIAVTYTNKTKHIELTSSQFDTIFIDHFKSKSKGYQHIDISGIEKTDDIFASIKSFVFQEPKDSLQLNYLKDDFYFGRRGPSTHLVFETPTNDTEWFYSEIEIDKEQDVIGSYFMANGFGEGYFGIQVNSETERRILFSIWSPFQTDDPKQIPEDQRITLLKKGNGVTTGEFGNEGSGGQSYKVFNWKAETRYGFLTSVHPNGDNTTDYTSYFFDPGTSQWHLIASFRRPKTDTYLTRPYSFLENFIPDYGVISRQGHFYNQWMRDSKGTWYEITEAKFSADATARKNARLDYSGGTQKGGFYLKNCGFTNHKTTIGSVFSREATHQKPIINFEDLAKL